VTSEKRKFKYVISQLEYKHSTDVENIIISPAADKNYTTPKTELVCRLSSSRDQRVCQLLTHEEIGESKPSQFLRHLILLTTFLSDDFLRSIWSSRLPPHIQTIQAGQAVGNLDAALHLAALITKVAPLHTAAAFIAQPPDPASLLQKIEGLSRQVADLISGRKRHRSGRNVNEAFPSARSRELRLLSIPSVIRGQGAKVYTTMLLPSAAKRQRQALMEADD
jgi:hypothetical protein